MSDRQAFIANIAKKLGRPTPTSVEPIKLKFPLYRLDSQEERIDKFMKMYEAMGGKAVQASTAKEAALALREWFGESPQWLNPNSIVVWNELPTMARACLEELGWPARSYADLPAPERNAIMDKMELGITGADFGIAQSGSLVLKSSAKRGRAVSLVPIRHLAFIPASFLRDSLDQVLDELMGTDIPAAIEIISGPSRTSDIEMDLSIGVHGPVEVYCILMMD
ncbi:LutC/YkgG family protein [Desulfitobacterium chlororespirans]|uniref:L-lactate dehydrogenase complex protein LldG n=1 Tax=Desulfitobacterium chlororespirans DSM 11544 TaxID=1121395 RepID=A0A1M7UQ09_9FIRM|nr:lactate utilization protein [Desulfitobacterium chlororespirans]SHN85014.1 L-lactate dehydrogenase complex protein LldG [Desulfitobacterium chlororespirans DSM 11544]